MKLPLPAVALLLAACGAPLAPTPVATPISTDSPGPAASARASAAATIAPTVEPTTAPADTPPATEIGRGVILVPSAVAERPELPWCGHERVTRRGVGDVYDAAVRACWLDAYRSGRAAEFVSTGWTMEGARTRTFYRTVGGGGFEVIYDQTGDPAADRHWTAARCRSLQDVHTDPNGTDVFVEDDCEPISLPGTDDPGLWPTLHERLVLESLVAFAIGGEASVLERIPFSDAVGLGLGSEIAAWRASGELVDPAAWSVEREAFRGYAGPFSALETLAGWDSTPGRNVREIQISVGDHPHCASPPVEPPAELAALRRVSLQPIGDVPCLAWWTVDAYFTEEGRIAGITLDLWEP